MPSSYRGGPDVERWPWHLFIYRGVIRYREPAAKGKPDRVIVEWRCGHRHQKSRDALRCAREELEPKRKQRRQAREQRRQYSLRELLIG